MSDRIQVTPETADDLMNALRKLARQGVVHATFQGAAGQAQETGRLTCEYCCPNSSASLVLCRLGRAVVPSIPVRPRGYIPMRMGDYLAWFERGHNTVHIIYKSYGIEGEKLQTFTLASH